MRLVSAEGGKRKELKKTRSRAGWGCERKAVQPRRCISNKWPSGCASHQEAVGEEVKGRQFP